MDLPKNIVANHEATVIVFTCNTCPVAQAYEDRIIATAKEYAPRKVAFLAVNPNDADKIPQENMEAMKKRRPKRVSFPTSGMTPKVLPRVTAQRSLRTFLSQTKRRDPLCWAL